RRQYQRYSRARRCAGGVDELANDTYFFFFYGSARHRDLHSFPTRRSSDLSQSLSRPALSRHSRCGSNARSPAVLRPTSWRGPQRSEEHTSELQSLAYLVCRLLLEKKKRIRPRCTHPGTAHLRRIP